MKTASNISMLAIAILLLADVRSPVLAAEQGKNSHNQRGAVSIKNTRKPGTNHNAQWSADPERGWVRSDESHSTQRRDRLPTAPKQIERKNKGSDKGSKRF